MSKGIEKQHIKKNDGRHQIFYGFEAAKIEGHDIERAL
jgi:hypothetical protein